MKKMVSRWKIKRKIKSLEKSGKLIEKDIKELDTLVNNFLKKLSPELKEDSDIQLFKKTIQELRGSFVKSLKEEDNFIQLF